MTSGARRKLSIAIWGSMALSWVALVAWALARGAAPWRRGVLPKGASSSGLPIERCAFHGISYDPGTETCPACAADVRRGR
jgi:hypothetical protein